MKNQTQPVRGIAQHRNSPRRQRGVVLIIALIVLTAMTLAGLVMLRSVNATQSIAGNLAFKQNATSAADRGTEAAWTWIMNADSNLNADSGTAGYYATWSGGITGGASEFDPMTYDWGTLGDASNTRAREVTPLDGDDGTGNRIRVVTHRLCRDAVSPSAPGQNCVIVPAALQTGTGGGGASANIGANLIRRPYYRVTTRVDGPRNTVSYIQIVMF